MDSRQNFCILLVEDEPSIREVLMELLRDEGFDCVTSIDGKDASEKLKERMFDLVISDLRMPRMKGTELLEWCRAHNINVPIIFISANTDLLPDERQSLSEGPAVLLEKPIDFNHLIKTIEEMTGLPSRVTEHTSPLRKNL